MTDTTPHSNNSGNVPHSATDVPIPTPLTREDVEAIAHERVGELCDALLHALGLKHSGREIDSDWGAGANKESRRSIVTANDDDHRLPGLDHLAQIVIDRLSDIDGNLQRLTSVIDDRSATRVYNVRHYPSPSVDGVGTHSVGEAEVAGDGSAPPAAQVTDPQISARYDRPLNMIVISADGEDDVYLHRTDVIGFRNDLSLALEVQAKLGGAA